MSEPVWDELREILSSHTNRHVRSWKDAGRPVVGYFCSHVPTELILAAGALPLRLRPDRGYETTAGDAFLSSRVCSYVRQCASMILDGHYDFLDGEVTSNVCDHVRRCADVLRKKTDIAFHGFLSVPRVQKESLFAFYLQELRSLRRSLAEHFAVCIDDDALRQATRTVNRTRQRLRQTDAARREERPRLSGAESLTLHIASQLVPPNELVSLADRVSEAVASRAPGSLPRARLVLIGAELDDPRYVETIEGQGAAVVADTLSFGSRNAMAPVDESAQDPLEAIGRAYFFEQPAARMMGSFPERFRALTRLVEETHADGVIFERMVFCDPWAADQHNFSYRVRQSPSFALLSLTREHGVVPTGQLATRTQAFIEKIEINRARGDAHRGAA